MVTTITTIGGQRLPPGGSDGERGGGCGRRDGDGGLGVPVVVDELEILAGGLVDDHVAEVEGVAGELGQAADRVAAQVHGHVAGSARSPAAGCARARRAPAAGSARGSAADSPTPRVTGRPTTSKVASGKTVSAPTVIGTMPSLWSVTGCVASLPRATSPKSRLAGVTVRTPPAGAPWSRWRCLHPRPRRTPTPRPTAYALPASTSSRRGHYTLRAKLRAGGACASCGK